MKRKIFPLINICIILALTLSMVNVHTQAAAPQSANAQTESITRSDALVLVNSASLNYLDFQHFIQPYLDHFGIPYTLLDINTTPVGAGIADYAVILIGHRSLDDTGANLDAVEQGYISAAVSAGAGLVNFDNDLSADGSTPRYDFVNTVFGFGYTTSPSLSGVTFSSVPHYITERHTASETISTGNMNLAGISLPAGVDLLASTGAQPFLAATTYGQGRAVQWGSYNWMSSAVKGPLLGLDDLVWRSIVWAARKPFAMQGMPPFVTMRIDDVSGPLWWLTTANSHGFVPWLGLSIDEIDASESVDISSLVNSGKATAIAHVFSTNHYFYYDHDAITNFSDATMANNFATATQWFSSRNIPISKFMLSHWYENGNNVFNGLQNWGVEFVGTLMDPGLGQFNTEWMRVGPYRIYETGLSTHPGSNPYYADFMSIPGHPELDGQFFNCLGEIRDITGFEWMAPMRNDVAQAAQDGTAWYKRSFDSMAVAALFTHEHQIVDTTTQANWDLILQTINTNIASYQPIYVSIDHACQYTRAVKTSNITASQYDNVANQMTVTLSGSTDMATKFYLFSDNGGGIQQTLVDVPAFTGSTQVAYALPGSLDHIVISPNPGTVIAGQSLQFSAQGYDANNTPIPNLQFSWQVINGGGSVNPSGLFTAGATPGTYANTVQASLGSVQATATVQVNATALHHFSIDTISGPKNIGVPFQVTVRALDASGVPVVNYAGPAALSDSTGTIQPTSTGSFANGVWSGNVTISQAQTGEVITVSDGAVTGASNSFDVVNSQTCPCSIWSPTSLPVNPSVNDGIPIEVGVKFRSESAGFINGIRFYKGSSNTGNHTGNLWTSTGQLLASAVFTNETASGWQQVNFASPVPINPNVTYVASYHSSAGWFAQDLNYFSTSGVVNPPLVALGNGADGSNAVYSYSATSTFPASSYLASNYWVDVIFTTSTGEDTTPPQVLSVTPTNGAVNTPLSTDVRAIFNENLDPATVSGSTFELRDAGSNLVPASVTYNSATNTALLTPSSALVNSTTYTARLKGGSTDPRIKDLAGNALASDYVWSFTTSAPPPPPPDDGPGGPILVLSTTANPFSRYYAEILRAEGFNAFKVTDISLVDAAYLSAYDVVILGEMALNASQVTMLNNWVNAGGNLIAMRPDKQLAGLLGLADASSTRSNAYLAVNTANAPGTGIVNESIQYHGTADLYTLSGASGVAALYSDVNTPTPNPAVSLRSVGASGGQAAAFTFDLARSVVYTRQGNPAWAGQNRDGIAPTRPNDMFYGAAVGDPQPDWVNLNKVAIPQADEQQRLLGNLILHMNADRKPLPRFWYFPKGLKAVVVMTGDDHGWPEGGVTARFDQYKAFSPAGCSVNDWECVRSTAYTYLETNLTNAQAAAYNAEGFEIAVHFTTGCVDFTPASLDYDYNSQLTAWSAKYSSVPAPVSTRNHCIAFSDWDTQPKTMLSYGMRLDTNYYYFPDSWILDRPGFFTGSGMPMRFVDINGALIDVYQATTQMADEVGQSYPFTINTLLDRALGPEGFFGAFTVNMHTDNAYSPGSDAIVASAQARGVPVVSAAQMLTWLDGRNGSAFSGIGITGDTLNFSISAGAGARNLQAMLPLLHTTGALASLTRDGTPVSFTTQTIKGIQYAFFNAAAGAYQAVYNGTPVTDPIPPAVAVTAPANGAEVIGTISLTADATDNVGVVGVQFKLDGANLGAEDTAAPYALSWDSRTAANGAHTITAVARDAAGNSTTSAVVNVTTNNDLTPPAVTVTSPVSGAVNVVVDANVTATFSEALDPLTVSGSTFELRDGAGTLIAGTVSYDGVSRTATLNPTNLLANSTSYTATVKGGAADPRVKDVAGNALASDYVWSFTTAAAVPINCPCSVWDDTALPELQNVTDFSPIEVGFKFRSQVDGYITGLRFFKGELNTGVHIGHLWSTNGTQLAEVTFTNETASGWQQVSLASPVAISAGTTYIASYYSASGYFADTMEGFATAVDNPPLRALANGEDGPNGVYNYGSMGFPSQNYVGHAPNYWVDVVFDTSLPGDTTLPVVAVTAPANGAEVIGTISLTADATDNVGVVGVQFKLDGANLGAEDTAAPYALSWDSRTAANGAHTITAVARDAAGNSTTSAVVNVTTNNDLTPPAVTVTSPVSGAVNVVVDANVTATFSEALDPLTVSGSTFELRDGAGTLIAGTVSYDGVSRTATLNPNNLLANSTSYTLTVKGGAADPRVKDLAGNALASDYVWSFTTAAAAPVIYAGSSTGGTAGGVAFADEDVLIYNTANSAWSLFFDGSDVGLANTDINAFDLLADGSLLLSFDSSTFTVPGIGTVEDRDIFRFIPTSTGANTAGTFELYLDGSDVGLNTSGEDIDALHVLPDGRIVVGAAGSFVVTGASGVDEDLFVFTPTSLGSNTSGTWAMYFDGSDVGLNTLSSENVNGVWVDPSNGDVYLTTVGAFSVTGASGDGADIFICHPTSLGSATSCTFGPGLFWDGSLNGFAGEVLDGFAVVR